MDNLIREYLKNYLSIDIKVELNGFNGQCVKVSLLVENEVISSDYFFTKQDDG